MICCSIIETLHNSSQLLFFPIYIYQQKVSSQACLFKNNQICLNSLRVYIFAYSKNKQLSTRRHCKTLKHAVENLIALVYGLLKMQIIFAGSSDSFWGCIQRIGLNFMATSIQLQVCNSNCVDVVWAFASKIGHINLTKV